MAPVLQYFLLFLSLPNLIFAKSHVTLENGGYNRVVVGIGDNIPHDLCRPIIGNLSLLAKSASRFLYDATHGLFHLSELRVVLPQDWTASSCGLNKVNIPDATFENFEESDIRIDTPHPAHGEFSPWTEQPGSCGQMGSYIHLPQKFLTDPKTTEERVGDRGRLFVKEWAKLRYGVYDEVGFPGDALFPPYYQTYQNGNSVEKPTLCLNQPVDGEHICGELKSTEECWFEPNRNNNNSHVTSSIMAAPVVKTVHKFCDDSTHNMEAPTKHNLLCNGKSVWDVIKKSQDYQKTWSNDKTVNTSKPLPPRLIFVKAAKKRVIFLLDNGLEMDQKNDRWTLVRQAIVQLVQGLDNGIRLGMAVYGENEPYWNNLTVLTSQTRGELLSANRLPMFANGGRNRDLVYAFNWALQQLKTPSVEGAHIVVVPGQKTLQHTILSELMPLLFKSGVKVSVIMYPEDTAQGFVNLAKATGEKSFPLEEEVVKGRGSLRNVEKLVKAMETVVQGDNTYRGDVIYSEVHTADSKNEFSGTFYVGRKMGRETLVGLYVFPERIHWASFKIQDPDGNVFSAPEYDGLESVFYYKMEDAVPGEWKYSGRFQKDPSQPVVIKVRSKPRVRGASLRLRAWTSWDQENGQGDPSQKPLVIYAQVLRGGQPVTRIQAQALVEFFEEDNKKSSIPVSLLDDGRGGVDITAGDGIYTGVFLQFLPASIPYSVTVYVRHTPGKSVLLVNRQGSLHRTAVAPCCGSTLPDLQGDPVGEFHLQKPLGSYFPTSPPVGDCYPPSKILDLKVKLEAHSTLTLTWTAPGSDLNRGAVSYYEIRYSRNLKNLMSGFDIEPELPGPTYPQVFGEREIQSFEIGQENSTGIQYQSHYYLAIRGVDQTGNKGPISNIAQIYIPTPPTTAIPTSTTEEQASTAGVHGTRSIAFDTDPSNFSFVHMAAIGGAIVGGIILILLFIIFYFFAVRDKSKDPNDKNNGSVDFVKSPMMGKKDNVFDDGGFVKSTSSGKLTPVPDVTKIGPDFERMHKGGSPITTTGHVSPVQSWSPSTLLSEHERRQSMSSPRSSVSGTVDSSYGVSHLVSTHPNPLSKPPRYASIMDQDRMSLQGSQRLGSFLSLSSDPNMQRPPSSQTTYCEHDNRGMYTIRTPTNKGPPPPVKPKPILVNNTQYSGGDNGRMPSSVSAMATMARLKPSNLNNRRHQEEALLDSVSTSFSDRHIRNESIV